MKVSRFLFISEMVVLAIELVVASLPVIALVSLFQEGSEWGVLASLMVFFIFASVMGPISHGLVIYNHIFSSRRVVLDVDKNTGVVRITSNGKHCEMKISQIVLVEKRFPFNPLRFPYGNVGYTKFVFENSQILCISMFAESTRIMLLDAIKLDSSIRFVENPTKFIALIPKMGLHG